MSVDSFTPLTTKTRLTLPLNGTVYTTTRQVSSEKPVPMVGDTMVDELGLAWEDSLIISVASVPQKGKEILTIVHARIPAEADQVDSNWEFSTADIGGQKFPSVQRTVVVLASTYSESLPAAGSAMPVVEGGLFDGSGYILVDRAAMRSGVQLEPVFKVEKRNYVLRSIITAMSIDSLNGKTLSTSSVLYYAAEVVSGGLTMAQLAADPGNAFWGVQSDGTQRTYQQISAIWFAVETQQLVGGEMVGGVVEVSSFTTNDNFSWPAVLESIQFFTWPRREGGYDIHPNITYRPERYDGPCLTTITRTWSKEPFTIPVVQQMIPMRITYGSPTFNLNVPECLHPAYPVNGNIGTTDQTWKWTTGTERVFPATNFTEWPDSIRAFDDQEPFRGGYLRTQRVVTAPAASPAAIPGKSATTPVLSDLVQEYTGSPLEVTVTTTPPGLTTVTLYNWGSVPPTDVGFYQIMCYIDDPAYNGSIAATFEITAAP